ncbi:NAD(P)H-dependent oxidoreductase [Devosia sp.]|uniref:NAD(P)H-dependent oxidoreductase n=1 Tax=Devosia sp. TaxID=1871048 RepID=UPI003A908CEA
MRVHVIHAHPVETSYNRSLFHATCEGLKTAGHEIDPLSLYDEDFPAVMSREERLNYHEVPGNLTPLTKPYVDRLQAADALVFVHPVWNYGYPAILKGYFDRIFLPGVSFRMESDGGENDKGKLVPGMTNIKKVAYVTTYGGSRFRTMVMGDPPRRLAMRWGWVTFSNRPQYLALYDMNNQTPAGLTAFLDKVKSEMSRF